MGPAFVMLGRSRSRRLWSRVVRAAGSLPFLRVAEPRRTQLAATGTPSGLLLSAPTRDGEPNHAAELALARPQPNPSVGGTALTFTLPQSGSARIEVLDLSGRRVWCSAGEFAAGTHSVRWDGHASSGSSAPAGVYFVRLVSAGGTRVAMLARL